MYNKKKKKKKIDRKKEKKLKLKASGLVQSHSHPKGKAEIFRAEYSYISQNKTNHSNLGSDIKEYKYNA